MTRRKQLWLLVGGNGAGKSTFYRLRLEPLGLPLVNADLIARELFPDDPESKSYLAARIAEDLRTQLLRDGRSFCFETVFQVRMLDNSSLEQPFQPFVTIRSGHIEAHVTPLPAWAAKVLAP